MGVKPDSPGKKWAIVVTLYPQRSKEQWASTPSQSLVGPANEGGVMANSVALVDVPTSIRRRSARFELNDETPPVYHPETRSLQYIGRGERFSARMDFVKYDPFVRSVLTEMLGPLPNELKGYSRSGATLTRLYDSLSRYDREYKPLPKNDARFAEAVRRTFAAFRLPEKIKSIKLEEVDLSDTWDSSAGWTWAIGGRSAHKGEVYDLILDEAKKIKRLSRNGRLAKKWLPPCQCYKRTQLAMLVKPKVRLVWGVPAEIILLEGQFAQPLIKAYSTFDGPMYCGRTMLKALPMFIDYVTGQGRGLAIDWSGFDSSVTPGLIEIAFRVLLDNFEITGPQLAEIDTIVNYFLHCGIVMPDGHAYVKRGGVPSGSFFTQLVDSVVNYLVITYLQLCDYCSETAGEVLCEVVIPEKRVLGDDSLSYIPKGKFVDLENWAKLAEEKFGMKLNVAKSMIADSPEKLEFLGHSARLGRISRDLIRLLLLALYPEQRVTDANVSVARVQGILIDSGYQYWFMLRFFDEMKRKYGAPGKLNDKYIKFVVQRKLPQGKALPHYKGYALS
jgi:hypothetical protein